MNTLNHTDRPVILFLTEKEFRVRLFRATKQTLALTCAGCDLFSQGSRYFQVMNALAGTFDEQVADNRISKFTPSHSKDPVPAIIIWVSACLEELLPPDNFINLDLKDSLLIFRLLSLCYFKNDIYPRGSIFRCRGNSLISRRAAHPGFVPVEQPYSSEAPHGIKNTPDVSGAIFGKALNEKKAGTCTRGSCWPWPEIEGPIPSLNVPSSIISVSRCVQSSLSCFQPIG